MILIQILSVIFLVSITQAIHHQIYYSHPQPQTYHPIQSTVPSLSKGPVSFSSLISHHTSTKTPQSVASIQSSKSGTATSFASFSSSLTKPGKSIPAFHYAIKPATSTFPGVDEVKVAPVVQIGHHVENAAQKAHNDNEIYAEPKYEFKYGIEDAHTGDKKSHQEQRDGDHTQGQYSLIEPDGTILTVDYSVIGKSGFNAIVHRTGHAVHPQIHKTH